LLILFTLLLSSCRGQDAGQWDYVLKVLRSYYEENRQNPAASAFSEMMWRNAEGGAKLWRGSGRGEFVLDQFTEIARSIDENRTFWRRPFTQEDIDSVQKVLAMDQGVLWKTALLVGVYVLANFDEGSQVVVDASNQIALDLGAVFAGRRHFAMHLNPGFRHSIAKQFERAVKNVASEDERRAALRRTLVSIRDDHEQHLGTVLAPSIRHTGVLTPLLKELIVQLPWGAPAEARSLRRKVLTEYLEAYARGGIITRDTYGALMCEVQTCEAPTLR